MSSGTFNSIQYSYITSISTPYPGYAVALPHPDIIGKYIRKNFFGVKLGLDEYLMQAVDWRNGKYFELYGTDVPERVFHRKQSNSNTGIPGVNEVVKKIKKKSKTGPDKIYSVPCIIASIATVPGDGYQPASGTKTKVLSIAKYGRDEAIRLATEWRKEMELKLLTEKS
jgi:hypothetical protein